MSRTRGIAAEDGLLRERDTLDGEQFLGIRGAVTGDGVSFKVDDLIEFSRRTTAKEVPRKACLMSGSSGLSKSGLSERLKSGIVNEARSHFRMPGERRRPPC